MATLTLPRRKRAARPHRQYSDVPIGATEVVVFPSELGWMAAVVRQDTDLGPVLCELTFGHDSPQRAVARLDSDLDAGASPAKVEPPFVRKLQAFARGERVDLSDVAIDLSDAPPFARRVVELCRKIPYGRTLTYSELAAKAGSPRAARAVGNVMRTNRCPLLVPCHRVVPRNAGLGGYSAAGGVRTKLRLLEMEGAK